MELHYQNIRIFSLRSTEDGLDVSEIASKFGGGGHKHAAGFSVPLEEALTKPLDDLKTH